MIKAVVSVVCLQCKLCILKHVWGVMLVTLRPAVVSVPVVVIAIIVGWSMVPGVVLMLVMVLWIVMCVIVVWSRVVGLMLVRAVVLGTVVVVVLRTGVIRLMLVRAVVLVKLLFMNSVMVSRSVSMKSIVIMIVLVFMMSKLWVYTPSIAPMWFVEILLQILRSPVISLR